jgi:DNA polymerase III subunit alpha
VPLDDAAHVFDLLGRGRHHGRVPAGVAADARAAAGAGAEQLRGRLAVLALYRPGPMSVNMHYDYADRKNGRKPVEYFHPDAEEVLGDTFGLMIYQESVMRVAQKFAGYSLAEADNLRKACGKKVRELMAKEREGFEAGCERTGYGARSASSCSTSSRSSPTTPSTRATPSATASSRTRPPT